MYDGAEAGSAAAARVVTERTYVEYSKASNIGSRICKRCQRKPEVGRVSKLPQCTPTSLATPAIVPIPNSKTPGESVQITPTFALQSNQFPRFGLRPIQSNGFVLEGGPNQTAELAKLGYRNHSLAVSTDGLPLGLTAVKFWTRDEFKGCNVLQKKINPTRVPVEEKES